MNQEIKLGYFKPSIADAEAFLHMLYNVDELEHNADAERQLFTEAIKFLNAHFHSDVVQIAEYIEGIEIGVLDGDCSRHLLGILDNIRLLGIDPLIPDSMEASMIGSIEKIRTNTEQFGERFHFWNDYSQNVVDSIENNSLHFIFIDGDHTYEAVKRDYELYYPKVKKGGMMFFHDSRMNRGGANFHVGSSKFVDELIANYGNNLILVGEAFSLTCFIKK